ncbi:hypothetical protein [Undibacterium sp. SXout20W]|uniref:hypothetical protein n=1 Tax=Undibacterium sp. SXout20W TaxID=3413051 RepID=UPI003BF45C51
MFKKSLSAVATAVFVSISFIATAAHAAPTPGPDLTPLTGAVDFTTTTTAVLAISGLMATVYLAIKGAKIVLRMIKGA